MSVKLGATKMPKVDKKLTLTQLVDQLGQAWEQRKHWETLEERLKAELKRNGAGLYKGKQFDISLVSKVKSYYAVDLLRKNVDEDVLAECEVKAPYLEANPTRRIVPKLRVVK